jgi:hypothetical protein
MFDVALAVAPGLQNIGRDIAAELKRQAIHGSMELASANHTGNAFVPYGPGQYSQSVETLGHEAVMEPQREVAMNDGQQMESGRER